MDRWTVAPGTEIDIDSIDAGATPGAPGDKKDTKHATDDLRERLADLQVRLRAEQQRSLLVVLQALDGGGKDSTIRSVFKGVDPMGVHARAFGRPSAEELAHDFLWRIHAHVPAAGEITIFNRSHYEDVVAVPARELAPREVWEPRFESISDFERHLVRSGTTVVKLFLHVSETEQAERFEDRMRRPDKRWKFDPSDLEDRERRPAFLKAYERAISRTSIPEALWRIIPADRKWYRDWAVISILVDTLEEMDPVYPDP